MHLTTKCVYPSWRSLDNKIEWQTELCFFPAKLCIKGWISLKNIIREIDIQISFPRKIRGKVSLLGETSGGNKSLILKLLITIFMFRGNVLIAKRQHFLKILSSLSPYSPTKFWMLPLTQVPCACSWGYMHLGDIEIFVFSLSNVKIPQTYRKPGM